MHAMNESATSDIKQLKSEMNTFAFSALYATLLLVRFICVVLPGYIHPDEFFQGGQELFFGTVETWEWKEAAAARSILPPLFMTWLPIQGARLLFWGSSVRISWLAPRLWMTCLSLVVDAVCWNLGNRKSVLLLASAWPTLLFLTRPWSNSLETLELALLFWSVTVQQKGLRKNLCLGGLAAIGLWTRFSFPLFAFPVYLKHLCTAASVPRTFLGLATGFLLMAGIFLYSDILFYHGAFAWGHVPNTIAPLNLFLYNFDVTNLAQHGLHFQGLHALVNMPMLFGVIGIWFYWDYGFGEPSISNRLVGMCRWTIVSGVVLLSCSPHQEPRFLLPCLVPLCILASQMPVSKWVMSIWMGSNLLIGVFWGVLHQGQVTNSLLALNDFTETTPPSVVYYYWRTFMPPTFLVQPCNTEEQCTNLDIIDAKSSHSSEFIPTMDTLLQCGHHKDRAIHVVTPTLYSSHGLEFSPTACHVPSYNCTLIRSHWPHVSTEDLPPWRGSLSSILNDLQLGVYLVSCLAAPVHTGLDSEGE